MGKGRGEDVVKWQAEGHAPRDVRWHPRAAPRRSQRVTPALDRERAMLAAGDGEKNGNENHRCLDTLAKYLKKQSEAQTAFYEFARQLPIASIRVNPTKSNQLTLASNQNERGYMSIATIELQRY
jgi:hypothetical protein